MMMPGAAPRKVSRPAPVANSDDDSFSSDDETPTKPTKPTQPSLGFGPQLGALLGKKPRVREAIAEGEPEAKDERLTSLTKARPAAKGRRPPTRRGASAKRSSVASSSSTLSSTTASSSTAAASKESAKESVSAKESAKESVSAKESAKAKAVDVGSSFLDDLAPAADAIDPFADPFAKPKAKKPLSATAATANDDLFAAGPAALDPFARPKRDAKKSEAAAESVDLFGSKDVKSKSAKAVADSLFDF